MKIKFMALLDIFYERAFLRLSFEFRKDFNTSKSNLPRTDMQHSRKNTEIQKGDVQSSGTYVSGLFSFDQLSHSRFPFFSFISK